jgi:hypothetical protein
VTGGRVTGLTTALVAIIEPDPPQVVRGNTMKVLIALILIITAGALVARHLQEDGTDAGG